ncbi:MAG TPA: protein kinase [Kofleriaceae bacterium]|nr:protein kinase [Kofleriaceae bacterium]
MNPAFVGVRLAEVQLMREACILESLRHVGVPRVFECGVLDRRPWIATEFIDGVSVERAAADRPLPIGDALTIVRDAAAILAHAHARGVVHRNITPRSIIRTPGRSFPLCITEWGDASVNDNAIPHVADPGARFYRAPELAVDGQGDGRADVFALGAVMFEAATLVLPEPVQKFPGMPAAFHQLLAGMLTRSPEDRLTASAVHTEAARLAEVFTDAEGPIEEVEVELVDISRNPPPMPSLGWMPSNPLAPLQDPAVGTARRRRES